jgi:hypothetical protein
MAILNILRPFGIFYGHFGNLVVIWYIFSPFLVCCIKKKSGNPGPFSEKKKKKKKFSGTFGPIVIKITIDGQIHSE